MSQSNWTVLLIGGVSGTGKSTVASEIGRSLGMPWLQVDDLRLAYQRSQVQLPRNSDALYYFSDIDQKKELWQQPPEILCEALISVADLMSPGIEVIVESHLDQQQPIIIEGDGIAPSLLSRDALRNHPDLGAVRAVFLVEDSAEDLYSNFVSRGRGIEISREADLRTEARAKMLFGQWIAGEARKYGLPVLEAQPWTTLKKRVLRAIGNE